MMMPTMEHQSQHRSFTIFNHESNQCKFNIGIPSQGKSQLCSRKRNAFSMEAGSQFQGKEDSTVSTKANSTSEESGVRLAFTGYKIKPRSRRAFQDMNDVYKENIPTQNTCNCTPVSIPCIHGPQTPASDKFVNAFSSFTPYHTPSPVNRTPVGFTNLSAYRSPFAEKGVVTQKKNTIVPLRSTPRKVPVIVLPNKTHHTNSSSREKSESGIDANSHYSVFETTGGTLPLIVDRISVPSLNQEFGCSPPPNRKTRKNFKKKSCITKSSVTNAQDNENCPTTLHQQKINNKPKMKMKLSPRNRMNPSLHPESTQTKLLLPELSPHRGKNRNEQFHTPILKNQTTCQGSPKNIDISKHIVSEERPSRHTREVSRPNNTMQSAVKKMQGMNLQFAYEIETSKDDSSLEFLLESGYKNENKLGCNDCYHCTNQGSNLKPLMRSSSPPLVLPRKDVFQLQASELITSSVEKHSLSDVVMHDVTRCSEHRRSLLISAPPRNKPSFDPLLHLPFDSRFAVICNDDEISQVHSDLSDGDEDEFFLTAPGT